MEIFNLIIEFVRTLTFIRPAWFYALIPLVLLAALQFRNQKLSRSWQSIIDPKLLPHLLIGQSKKQSSTAGILVFVVGLLSITALAGPAWEKRAQPVFKEQSALVIALDLSRSMDAADIKPSRLTRARHKITDILKQRKLGQTALLVYAANAYTVSPLTDDTATITALLPSLTTDLMPTQGSRTDMAINKAVTLLENAGVNHGDILLVTDGVEDKAQQAIKTAAKKYRISILAIATKDGSPIPQETGGFFKDRRGAIVLPKLSLPELQKASRLGNGYLVTIRPDDSDINKLSSLFIKNRFEADKDTKQSSLKTDSWVEQGPWLLLLVIPFALLFFRRGILFAIAFILIQAPQPVHANTLWNSLWSNADQRAEKLLENNKPKEAAELFSDKQWKASAYFKDQQYQKSIAELEGINTADAHYNKGNAFAKLGETEKAIKQYNAALKLEPKHEDAAFNKNILLKQQKQKSNKSSSDDNRDSSKDKTGNQSKNSEKQDSQSGQKSKEKQQQSSQQDQAKNNNSDKQDNAKQEDPKKNNSSDTTKAEEKALEKSKQATDKKQAKETKKKSQDAEQDAQTKKITQQWLRQIADDPGGLLRNKFKYQYQRQDKKVAEDQNW